MDNALWSRITEVFHAALELSEEQRAAFVDTSSDGNEEIRSTVQKMLDEDRRGATRLGRGVAEIMDQVLSGSVRFPFFVPPDKIGPYERIEFLGRGGMGAVWKYVRSDTGLPMAIKFLIPLEQFPDVQRSRFAQEINTLARLRHPNIVSFHDAGALGDGTPWFVMDYVEESSRGMRFTAYCRLPGRSIDEQLRFFRTVCEAVLYAHLQGIIHRDLKPSNILMDKDGCPRIVDFGIARQVPNPGETEDPTSPTQRFMSFGYSAPEWKLNGEVGVYTDVYSLGVILYEILAGRHPFRKSGQALRIAEADADRKPPEKPSAVVRQQMPEGSGAKLSRSAWSDLDKLCLTAMHVDPRERYHSVESLIRDIGHYLNSEPLDAQPGMLRYRAGKFVWRNRRAVAAAAAALVLIITITVSFMWKLSRERNIALAEAERVGHIQDFMNGLLQGGDQEAGPAADLRVTAMIDRGVQQAAAISNDPQVQADLDQTLGTMSQKLGRLEQADGLLQKALHEHQSLTAPEPDGIAGNLIALGLLRADEGKSRDAEQLVHQALVEIQSRNSGNKALLGKAELALGTVMVAAGRQKDAVPVLTQAASTFQSSSPGSQSPELARTFATLGDAETYLGDYAQAESFNRRALAIDQTAYGNTHPHIAEDLGNLAQIDEVRGHYAEAEPLERQALAIMQRWYGSEHPETARKMTTLGSTLVFENKVAEADGLLNHAVGIQERVYGSQHPKVAYAVNSLGLAALHEKKYNEAEKDYRIVEEIYRQAYGDKDYRVAVALGNLASAYQAEKRYPECEHIMRDVVERFTQALGASNIQTGMAQVRLGRTLLHENKFAEASEHSRAGYEILHGQTSSTTSYVEGSRHDLAIAYAALGQPEMARQFGAQPAKTPAPHSK